MARERERLDREELLSQRFTTNDQSDTSIAIDAALQMNDRLQVTVLAGARAGLVVPNWGAGRGGGCFWWGVGSV